MNFENLLNLMKNNQLRITFDRRGDSVVVEVRSLVHTQRFITSDLYGSNETVYDLLIHMCASINSLDRVHSDAALWDNKA